MCNLLLYCMPSLGSSVVVVTAGRDSTRAIHRDRHTSRLRTGAYHNDYHSEDVNAALINVGTEREFHDDAKYSPPRLVRQVLIRPSSVSVLPGDRAAQRCT